MTTFMARQLAVFFFSCVALLAEALLFHATQYVLDYMLAMAVISCAVAGVGLGAFLARHEASASGSAFGWCCGGTAICLYGAAWTLLRWPDLFLLLPAMASVFICPAYFIARALADGPVRRVYLFDMLGAGVAIVVTVAAYECWSTEEIFLGLVTALPVAGALAVAASSSLPAPRRFAAAGLWLTLAAVGAGLLHQQVTHHTMQITRLVNPAAPNIPSQSLLRRPSRLKVERTYDSLVGRLDTLPVQDNVFVTYDGFFNDNFTSQAPRDYAQFAGPAEIRFPSVDRRVVYGLVPTPQVFVIGPATTGILKTLRAITPVEHMEAVEINPGVLQIMLQDYFEASGRAYEGLRVTLGNALPVLRRAARKYDVITLINAHSSRWIGALGPPDYLHTRESYDVYLDHLSEDGYLLFEERPETRRGELGLRRMILTLYDCLARRGVRDPAEHFFIWEFMSHRYDPHKQMPVAPGSDMYYVGMVVSPKPLTGQRRDDLLAWCNLSWWVYWDDRNQPVHVPHRRWLEPAYLKGQWHGERFGPFFEMLAAGDFAALEEPFDATLVTDDRPFPSYAATFEPELWRLLCVAAGTCLIVGALFVRSALRGVATRGVLSLLLLYNVATGCAYFFVEIMLMQAYQRVFLSPSASLVLVLGVLLIGSAFGGLLAERVPLAGATVALIPVLLTCLRIPDWTMYLGFNSQWTAVAAVAMIWCVGLTLGVFFPAGLLLAQRGSLRHRIPHLFALNALSGSLATVVSLYLGVRIGYSSTLAVAFALYVAAALAYYVARRRAMDGAVCS
jgi:hypothetical protein